tara:strand:+ start:6241 stop:6528 length:288 start_codon:yes stop_codon:yes gene_type:complete
MALLQPVDNMWYEVFARCGDAKMATAICNLRRGYQEIAARRQAKACKLISYIPPAIKGAAGIKGTIAARCGATTLAGKPCPFRATCGKFCKKHVV